MNKKEDAKHTATVAALADQARIATSPCGDGKMVWRIWGEGHPLILFHGAHGSWTHWFNNIPGLAKHFKVMVPDLPGMGDSTMPPEPYTFSDISQVVSDGVDVVLPAPAEFSVAGFSFGSSIAGFVAFYQGERVKNLGLISSGGMGLTRTEPTGLQNWRLAETEAERVAANRHNLGVLMFGDPDNIDGLAVSMTKPEQIDEYLVASGDGASRRGDIELLRKYAAIHSSQYCRPGCDACLTSCPESVQISEVLRARMYKEDYADIDAAKATYAELKTDASACTTCLHESCANACPFGLKVSTLLRDTADSLASS